MTNFNIILQECYFDDPLPRLFKPFGFVKKHGRQGGGGLFSLYIYIENFKNLLVRNHWTDFNIILQECCLVILYPDCSSHLDSSKNMAARGRSLFFLHVYIYMENSLKASCQKHWADFNIILQKRSFSNPLPRLFKPFGFLKKHGHQRAGLIFPIYLYRKV